jgi:hypothetical protein
MKTFGGCPPPRLRTRLDVKPLFPVSLGNENGAGGWNVTRWHRSAKGTSLLPGARSDWPPERELKNEGGVGADSGRGSAVKI